MELGIGVVTSSFGPCDTIDQQIERAYAEGFRHVQLTWLADRLRENAWAATEHIQRILPRDMTIRGIVAVSSEEEKPLGEWLSNTQRHIVLAYDLGVSVVSGHMPSLSDNPSEVVHHAIFVAARYANDLQVTYAVEIGDEPLTYVEGLDQIPYVRFSFDTGNILKGLYGLGIKDREQLNDRLGKSFETLRSKVSLVHVKDWDPNKQFNVKLGEGYLDLQKFLRTAYRYKRPLLLEDSGDIHQRASRVRDNYLTLSSALDELEN